MTDEKTKEGRAVAHGTFVIERSYPVPTQRVFRAFSDPKEKQRWFAGGDSMEVEHLEGCFEEGGREHARFRIKSGPIRGSVVTNEGQYLDIVPDRRIVNAYTMAVGEHRISASLATVELLATDKGTDLIFTHQGVYFEGADGPEMREAGWQKLLEKLGAELLPR